MGGDIESVFIQIKFSGSIGLKVLLIFKARLFLINEYVLPLSIKPGMDIALVKIDVIGTPISLICLLDLGSTEVGVFLTVSLHRLTGDGIPLD